MTSDRELAEIIAAEAEKNGGKAYYVGGCVRDELIGAGSKDIDVEIHGIKPETLEKILDGLGGRMEIGKSFGIYGVRGHRLDIALPREERSSGSGHRDFDVKVDPFIGERRAAERRDFTINAMMKDVLSGEIIDFFGGREDLKNGIIRHVSDRTFPEDPLRVLRAAQFSARFGFTVHADTKKLCEKIRLDGLSRERIFEETRKALLKSFHPSVFFEFLRETGHLLVWFPELFRTIGVPQDVRYHPEGDVWTHTMLVLDRSAGYAEKTASPIAFMFSALCHDFGKIVCTEETETGIHAYGHETAGLPLARAFIQRLTAEHAICDYVLNLTEYHMKPSVLAAAESSVKSTNRMFDSVRDPEGLVYLSLADGNDGEKNAAFLFERLRIYREYMARPFVTGRDLIESGIEPSDRFSEYLSYAHKLRLAGVSRENALRQTLAMAKNGKK